MAVATKLTVAILGRPNVGKSTLFNRLAGRKLAIVHETPGVTRDRREAEAHLGDLRFTVIDTAGLEEAAPETLAARMQAQTKRAVAEADLALLMIDARAGVTPADRHFARWLHQTDIPVVLVANKCDASDAEAGVLEAYSLALGEPVAISAAHGEGLVDLYEAIAPFAGQPPQEPEADLGEGARPERAIRLAVVGRPNVGKSTLVNRLLGTERMLTGPEPGITRDSIAVPLVHHGRAFELVDTAGLRRQAKITKTLEHMSVADTLRVIRLAQVVILVIDAEQMFEQQDLAIARLTAEEGRALVIALNKWDLIARREAAVRKLREALETSLPQVKGVAWVALSALTGENVDELMPAIVSVYEIWNRRIPTAKLNRFLAQVSERHPPPAPGGKPIQIRYMTQVKARPPSFALFVNKPESLPDTYMRYLANGLRREFGLAGVPLRLMARKTANPFASRRKPRPRPGAKAARRRIKKR